MNSAPSSPCWRALAAHPVLTSLAGMRRSPILICGLNRRHVTENTFRRSVNRGAALRALPPPASFTRVLQDAIHNRSQTFKSHPRSAPFADPEVSEELKAWRPLKKGSGPR